MDDRAGRAAARPALPSAPHSERRSFVRCRRASYNAPGVCSDRGCWRRWDLRLRLRSVWISAGIRERWAGRAWCSTRISARQQTTSHAHGGTRFLSCAVGIAGLHRVCNSLHLLSKLLQSLDLRARDRTFASAHPAAISQSADPAKGTTARGPAAAAERALDTFVGATSRHNAFVDSVSQFGIFDIGIAHCAGGEVAVHAKT